MKKRLLSILIVIFSLIGVSSIAVVAYTAPDYVEFANVIEEVAEEVVATSTPTMNVAFWIRDSVTHHGIDEGFVTIYRDGIQVEVLRKRQIEARLYRGASI